MAALQACMATTSRVQEASKSPWGDLKEHTNIVMANFTFSFDLI